MIYYTEVFCIPIVVKEATAEGEGERPRLASQVLDDVYVSLDLFPILQSFRKVRELRKVLRMNFIMYSRSHRTSAYEDLIVIESLARLTWLRKNEDNLMTEREIDR